MTPCWRGASTSIVPGTMIRACPSSLVPLAGMVAPAESWCADTAETSVGTAAAARTRIRERQAAISRELILDAMQAVP